MSVVSSDLRWNFSGSVVNDSEREWTAIYIVVTDNPADHAATVIDGADVGEFGDTLAIGSDTDTTAYITKKHAELVSEEEARKVWHLTVQYRTSDLERAEVRYGFTSIKRALDRDFLDADFGITPSVFRGGWHLNHDLSNKATGTQFPSGRLRDSRSVTNTAGEPFDPPLQYDIWIQTITISRDETDGEFLGGFWLTQLQGRINDDSIFGFAKYQVLLAGTSAAQKYRGDTKYYRVTYEFHCHLGDELWYEPVLNTGFTEAAVENQQDYTDETKRRLIKVNGEPVNVPQLLDVDGNVVTPSKNMAEQAVYVPVWPYPAADFSDLGLDLLL